MKPLLYHHGAQYVGLSPWALYRHSIASQGLTSQPQVRTESWAADPYPEIALVAVRLVVQLAREHVYPKHRQLRRESDSGQKGRASKKPHIGLPNGKEEEVRLKRQRQRRSAHVFDSRPAPPVAFWLLKRMWMQSTEEA